MGIAFDKNDTDGFPTPKLGVQVAVMIGQCDEAISSNNNPMIVLNVRVQDGEEGAGFTTKYYLVKGRMFNYNCKQIMVSANMDIDAIDVVDDMTFRDRHAFVTFKNDSWKADDGTVRTSVKIDKFVEGEAKPTTANTPTEEELDEVPF